MNFGDYLSLWCVCRRLPSAFWIRSPANIWSKKKNKMFASFWNRQTLNRKQMSTAFSMQRKYYFFFRFKWLDQWNMIGCQHFEIITSSCEIFGHFQSHFFFFALKLNNCHIVISSNNILFACFMLRFAFLSIIWREKKNDRRRRRRSYENQFINF